MRARLLPVLVHVTCVPATIDKVFGLNDPPPPLIVIVAKAIGEHVGCGDGLGLTLGLGETLGLGDGLMPGDGLGLTVGDGEGLGVPFCASASGAASIVMAVSATRKRRGLIIF